MYNCRASGNQPLIMQLCVQDRPISMEVDTGATLSIISRHTYNTSWGISPSTVGEATCRFCWPFQGKMFLILIDAYSKWLEVKPLTAATSTVTIEHLREIFSTHGLPEILVTDNGSQFTSAEFQTFKPIMESVM